MNHSTASRFLLSPAIAIVVAVLLLNPVKAEDWKRVESKDGTFSALFPIDIKQNLQTATDKTLAGKVTSFFGEYYGDGILLAASGADIPGIAKLAGENKVYEESKKTFLKEAQGTEISFTKTKVKGSPARLLTYKGDAYRGKGEPYQGTAILIIHNKRMYIVNSVLSKATAENKASEKKLFDSIEASK